jgi:hypothetical protein
LLETLYSRRAMTDIAAAAPLPLPANRRLAAGTAASFVVHGLLLAALLFLTPLKQLVVPPPAAVTVEIVTPDQLAALSKPQPAPPAAPAPRIVTSPAPEASPAPAESAGRLAPSPPGLPVAVGDGTVRATQFYAAGILNEPGMAHIRKAFGTLAGSEKLVQLCNIEGLEQIRRAEPAYDPDTLVGYAMADMETSGLTLKATGGAFRSRRKWYGVTFQCTVAADLSAVTAFEFRLGQPIPEDQWEDHNLNAEDADE